MDMEIEIYRELQEINENRRRRLEAYSRYINQETMKQMSGIVEQLVELRKEQGKTQQDISEATGMAAPNVARIESRKRVPTVQALMKYANALGMQIKIELEPEKRDLK